MSELKIFKIHPQLNKGLKNYEWIWKETKVNVTKSLLLTVSSSVYANMFEILKMILKMRNLYHKSILVSDYLIFFQICNSLLEIIFIFGIKVAFRKNNLHCFPHILVKLTFSTHFIETQLYL